MSKQKEPTPAQNKWLIKNWLRRYAVSLDYLEYLLHVIEKDKVSKDDGSYYVWVFLTKQTMDLIKKMDAMAKELQKPIEEMRPEMVL